MRWLCLEVVENGSFENEALMAMKFSYVTSWLGSSLINYKIEASLVITNIFIQNDCVNEKADTVVLQGKMLPLKNLKIPSTSEVVIIDCYHFSLNVDISSKRISLTTLNMLDKIS